MELSNLGNNPLDQLSLFFISSPPRPKNIHWSFEENKLFENALAEFDLTSANLFEKIAVRIPGKTIDQIKEHYEALLEDVEMIELGFVPLPDYKPIKNDENGSAPAVQNNSNHQQRKKGVPWTKEEHENFLIGLAKFGKGDWRSISRHCVQTRNPTQVASHAQKYYIRLQKSNAEQSVSSTSKPKKSHNSKNTAMPMASPSGSSGPGDTSTSG